MPHLSISAFPVLQCLNSLFKPRTGHKGKVAKMSGHLENRQNEKTWTKVLNICLFFKRFIGMPGGSGG